MGDDGKSKEKSPGALLRVGVRRNTELEGGWGPDKETTQGDNSIRGWVVETTQGDQVQTTGLTSKAPSLTVISVKFSG